MNERAKPISLLAVILVGVFALSGSSLFSIGHATYVEGIIAQDTIWSLTDSPYVVSKDIVVSSGVTLTIEPGVEIRFGGDFSLRVEGRLLAYGDENNTITFTSNRDQPKAGDWNATKFVGTELSVLTYCVMQYAKSPIAVEDSMVTIENCELAHNSESGIYVTGDTQVIINKNRISSSKNGIALAGNWTSGVSITENIVMNNSESGIGLRANNYGALVILNNVLSANKRGFLVSGQPSTYITGNSISYNEIGLFYTAGTNHVAEYNDIYGNELGMDASSDATVNAEHNYWGHESGPYHVSLNPAGEGDPVGGDGLNLDFIFALTAPIGHINTRPTATLLTDKTLVPSNQPVTFIASTSSDDGRVDMYRFDYGDGFSSGWTTLSVFTHEYSSPGTYNASVTVLDDFGVWSTNVASELIDVQNLNSPDVAITPSRYQVFSGGEVPLTVHTTYGTSALENASITLFAVRSGNLTPSSGLTNSTGYFTTTFVAPNVNQTTHVRITARASHAGYAHGSDYIHVTVSKPEFLVAELTAEPTALDSEENSFLTVHVTHNATPVSDVNVTLSSAYGSCSPESGVTDLYGDATFTFTAPQVFAELNFTITATATKTGYADGQDQVELTVSPGTLSVHITAVPYTVEARGEVTVRVYVAYNAQPLADALVTLQSEGGGDLSPVEAMTDSNGDATFTFTAPEVRMESNVTIVATAAKVGYVNGGNLIILTVNPAYGVIGLPPTAILAIVIIVVIVAIVIILLKLNIIYISRE